MQFLLLFYHKLPPPGPGKFFVEPSSGIELKIVFSLIATDWTDREENYPLNYALDIL